MPSGGVIHLIRALDTAGVDYSSIACRLPQDFSSLTQHNRRIDAGKIPEIYSLAMSLPVPGDFWLRLGNSFSVHNWHLELSNWILTGKNFADIMPKLNGLYAVDEGPPLPVSLSDDGRWIEQPMGVLPRDHDNFRSDVELAAATLVRGLKSLLGERELQAHFSFGYAAPEYAAAYREVLGEQVSFDADSTEVRLPKDYFYRAFLSSDAVMHQYYEEQLQEFFPDDTVQRSPVGEIEALLLDCRDRFPSLVEVCAQLGISERKLRRQLQQHGTSYREILLNTRMQRAAYYLEHTDISIEEIAHRLDYSDYANFRRAFQSRHGVSPSAYRRGVG